MTNLQEFWLPVINFPRYEISSLGNIRSSITKQPLKKRLNQKGYEFIGLRNNSGKQKTCLIHRLVAIHFISNPYNKKEVNHKWGNKRDNRASELEWATRNGNENHAKTVLGKIYGFDRNVSIVQGANNFNAKSVICLKEGKIIKEYPFIRAVKDDGFSPAMVSHCCNGRKKSHMGFKWQYKN